VFLNNFSIFIILQLKLYVPSVLELQKLMTDLFQQAFFHTHAHTVFCML